MVFSRTTLGKEETMTQTREERKEFLREKMHMQMEIATKAVARQIVPAAQKGVSLLKVAKYAGRLSAEQGLPGVELIDGDRELMIEIAREERVLARDRFLNGWSAELEELNAIQEPMRVQLRREAENPLVVQPGDMFAIPRTISKEQQALKVTGLCVLALTDEGVLVCPFETTQQMQGNQTRSGYDLVLVGIENPMAAFLKAQLAIRVWMPAVVLAEVFTKYPITRLCAELHARAMDTLRDVPEDLLGRPKMNPTWSAAWASAMRRLGARTE